VEQQPMSEGQEDWGVVERMLPPGWREKAKELGALKRRRGFADATVLLRVLLIHLVDGCSLRETAVRAREGGLASVSDVALLKRLKWSHEWFRWMADGLMRQWISVLPQDLWGERRRIRVVDGSTISEPGATGSTWRLHYSISLPSLYCDEVEVTTPKVGESLKRFHIQAGDLLLADRGFAHRPGVRHVVDGGGDVVVRLNLTNLPVVDGEGEAFSILAQVRTLSATEVGDWPVRVEDQKGRIEGRVCAIKNSQHAAELARERIRREAAKKKRTTRPETLEACGYIFVFTTLTDREKWPADVVLEMYRGRWQVELAFKRLKSLLAVGHLKKTDPEGGQAWVQGKLFVALLIEALISAGERFFPWGYPGQRSQYALPVAGDLLHAPPA
jgi:Transposase DDE domain